MKSTDRYSRQPDDVRQKIKRDVNSYAEASSGMEFVELEARVLEAPNQQRLPLLSMLLPVLLDKLKVGRSLVPCRELCRRCPRIADEIRQVYPHMEPEHRLPDEIGGHLVLRHIGDGGQARTVLAGFQGGRNRCAIKYSPTDHGAARLKHEGEILKRVRHAKLRSFLDVGIDRSLEPATTYLVLEYAPGENLRSSYLGRPATPGDAVRILLDVSEAVAALHYASILHRDIKPDNIVAEDSKKAMLIDCGLAIDIDCGGFAPGSVGEHWGTDCYKAPEQLREQDVPNPKASDVYQLGAVLYFLITGADPEPFVPTEAQSKPAVQSGIADATGWRPDLFGYDAFPQALRDICRRAMATDPAKRFANAGEFHGALRRFRRRAWAPYTMAATTALALFAASSYQFTRSPASMQALTPAAPSKNWMQTLAEENNYSLDEINEDSFDVSYVVNPQSPDGVQSIVPHLEIVAFFVDHNLLGSLEYRIGTQSWKSAGLERLAEPRFIKLDRHDLAASGPVQLQLDTVSGPETGFTVGPLTYDISARDFQAIIKRKLNDIFAEVESVDWVILDGGVWRLDSRFKQQYWDAVAEFRVGVQKGSFTTLIRRVDDDFFDHSGRMLSSTEARAALENSFNAGGGLLASFEGTGVSDDVFYMQLVGHDGQTTEVRTCSKRDH